MRARSKKRVRLLRLVHADDPHDTRPHCFRASSFRYPRGLSSLAAAHQLRQQTATAVASMVPSLPAHCSRVCHSCRDHRLHIVSWHLPR